MAYAYQIVVEAILARIRSGEWREGEQIPPLAELEKLYPQSRMTLYKALQHLTDRGHLTMSRGRGTFVRAAHPRRRIAILTGSEVFGQGVATFAMQAFIHAHEFFAERGMDAQLYTEAPNSPMSMPAGLLEELERRKLSGIMTVMAGFPWRFMNEPQWKAFAIPHVHLGPGPVDHALDVDRGAFLDLALRTAAARRRRRVALLERSEHLKEHAEQFLRRCTDLGMTLCPPPAAMPDDKLPYEAYGYELLHQVWAASPRPDVVIVPDDVIAKGVTQAALALSIKVPEELTVIAMTNRGCRFFFPVPIVALEVDVKAMVAEGAGMLVDLMQNLPVPTGPRLVPPHPPADEPPAEAAPSKTPKRKTPSRPPTRKPARH